MGEHDGCDHNFNDHFVIAGEDPNEGGILRCPERGCPCESTWGIQGRRPSADLVERLRRAFESSTDQ